MDNKKKNSTIMGFFIVAVMFMLLYLVIPFTKRGASWTAFVFGLVAIAVSCIATLYIFNKKDDDLKSKVYGLPILKLIYLYFCVQLLVSLMIIIVAAIVNIPAWLPLVLGIFLLGLTAIGFIAADNVRDVIIEQEKNDAMKVQQMLTFKLDASGLIDASSDPTVKKAAEKFAEKLRYSDPVSSEGLAEIENNLSAKLNELAASIGGMSTDEALGQIDSLTKLLAERNRKCKALK